MATTASHRPALLQDLGLLLARIVLGVVFAAHGWQKIDQMGMAGVTGFFRSLGVPAPELAAPFVAWLELIGGILLILGALTPLIGVLLMIDMLVAALLAHVSNGLFVDAGGWELVGALGAGSLILALVGAGRLSLDGAIFGRTSRRRTRATATSAAGNGSTVA